MAVSIAKLAIQFVADTSGMIAGTKKAEGAMAGFVGKAKSIGGQLAGAFGFVGASAAVLGFVGSIRKSFKELDDLAKLSTKLGVPVEQLQLLDHAAGLSGVSTEQVAKAFAKMNDAIGEGVLGSKSANAAFERLGLSAEILKAKSPEQAFLDIADALNAVPSQATRTKMAMDIFGKSAVDLLPLLAEGREGIAALFAEREAMGLFDREQLARIEAANDAWDSMLTSLKMISGEIAVGLSPAFEAFSNQVRELQPEMRKLLEGIQGDGKGFQVQQDAATLGAAVAEGNLSKIGEGALGVAKFMSGATLSKDVAEVLGSSFRGGPRQMTAEELKQIGEETMARWAQEDAAAANQTANPFETMREQMNEQFGMDIGGAAENLQDNFAAGPEADKLFGRLKKPVLDTVGDLFSTIDRKANAALGGITGNVGDSALGNLLDSAEAGLQSFADASGMAQANIDALSASPAIGQAAALQRGTAEAFSTARQNAADSVKANEMKEQQKQSKLLEKIEKNTGIKTSELQTAQF